MTLGCVNFCTLFFARDAAPTVSDGGTCVRADGQPHMVKIMSGHCLEQRMGSVRAEVFWHLLDDGLVFQA